MYYFVSPNGTKYKTDKLKQFCEEKEITYHGAKKCLRGIQKTICRWLDCFHKM